MARRRATAEVIQAEMQKWIRASTEHDGACRGCEAPIPLALAAPRDGCNWTASFSKVLPGCQSFMTEIIDRARREYDLL